MDLCNQAESSLWGDNCHLILWARGKVDAWSGDIKQKICCHLKKKNVKMCVGGPVCCLMPAVYYPHGSKRLACQTWSGMCVCPEGKRHPRFVHFLRHVSNTPAWFNATVVTSTGVSRSDLLVIPFFLYNFRVWRQVFLSISHDSQSMRSIRGCISEFQVKWISL